MIKVVRGNPTPEELAAAVAVVQARAASVWGTEERTGDAPVESDAWADPGRVARTRLPVPGASAWRRTFWPV